MFAIACQAVESKTGDGKKSYQKIDKKKSGKIKESSFDCSECPKDDYCSQTGKCCYQLGKCSQCLECVTVETCYQSGSCDRCRPGTPCNYCKSYKAEQKSDCCNQQCKYDEDFESCLDDCL